MAVEVSSRAGPPEAWPEAGQARDLQAAVLRAGYQAGTLRVTEVIGAVYDRIAQRGADSVWISIVPRAEALTRAAALDVQLDAWHDAQRGAEAPTPAALPALFGLPFAVKDNIDVAGLATTAGCAAFGHEPIEHAPAVATLLEAGAVCVGKTNLDQFATGLSGARSPYGTPRSPFDPAMIAGGSSSGSGVAVAVGLVTFAVGTDTAGSGRVPAALSNVVGLKPSRGLVSTRGLVPACRSLDCLSVFALSAPDAQLVLSVMNGFDAADPYSRRLPLVAPPTGPRPRPGPDRLPPARVSPDGPGHSPGLGVDEHQGPSGHGGPWVGLRVGTARPADLTFFGDRGARAIHEQALGLVRTGGGHLVEIDLRPLQAAGALLYDGPWLAERFASVGQFVLDHPEQTHPVVRAVLTPGAQVSGADAFRGQDRLRALRRQAEQMWAEVDVLVLPTVPTSYPVDAVLADPVALNARLGHYTTFGNLLDLAAIAVPAGFAGGLPHGVTLLAPAGRDQFLAELAADFHARAGLPVGAAGHRLAQPDQATPHPSGPHGQPGPHSPAGPHSPPPPASNRNSSPPPASAGAGPPAGHVDLAVFGAHMSGLALNEELARLGAELVRPDRTMPCYRLFALPGGPPRRPGLVRVGVGGASVEAEVWRLPVAAAGTFLLGLPAPLSVGSVDLLGGPALGVLCESAAVDDAQDITAFGGWRAFLSGSRPGPAGADVP